MVDATTLIANKTTSSSSCTKVQVPGTRTNVSTLQQRRKTRPVNTSPSHFPPFNQLFVELDAISRLAPAQQQHSLGETCSFFDIDFDVPWKGT